MTRILFAIALSCAATPSLSLSCLPATVANSFKEAAASEQTYIVVHGTLSFDDSKLPKVDLERQDQTPPQTDIPGRLTGKSLSKSGFEATFDRPITVRAICLGPWCGKPVSGTEYLSFLEKTSDGYLLAISPCGGYDFANPTPEMLRTATQCMQGGDCQD